MFAELNPHFGMTTGAEPAAPATEGEQVLPAAVGATDTGKALSQVTALEVVADDVGAPRTKRIS